MVVISGWKKDGVIVYFNEYRKADTNNSYLTNLIYLKWEKKKVASCLVVIEDETGKASAWFQILYQGTKILAFGFLKKNSTVCFNQHL